MTETHWDKGVIHGNGMLSTVRDTQMPSPSPDSARGSTAQNDRLDLDKASYSLTTSCSSFQSPADDRLDVPFAGDIFQHIDVFTMW